MRVPWALLVALLWLAVAVWWAVPGLAGPDKRLPLLSAPPSLSPDGVTPRSHSPGPGTERGRDGGPLRAPRAGTEPRRPADGAGPTAAERAAGGAGASAGADRAASRRTRAGGDTRDTGRGGGGGGADPRAAAEGPAARRSHAPGRRPDPPNGDRGPAVAGRPAAGGRPPPATARYVRICSVYGDLSNQILAVVKAYAVADVLNRTLVLPLIRQVPLGRPAAFALRAARAVRTVASGKAKGEKARRPSTTTGPGPKEMRHDGSSAQASGTGAPLTGPCVSYYEARRRSRRKYVWALKTSNFFFTKYVANDDLSILDSFPLMAEVIAVPTVFPDAGLLRFLLRPKTQISQINELKQIFPTKNAGLLSESAGWLPNGRSSPIGRWCSGWSRER